MTSSIKVKSHNYPVLVQSFDPVKSVLPPSEENGYVLASESILWPEDGEQVFHCTTTRMVRAVDLAMDDPRALAARKAPTP